MHVSLHDFWLCLHANLGWFMKKKAHSSAFLTNFRTAKAIDFVCKMGIVHL